MTNEEIAMHLWAGYTELKDDTLDNISYVAGFVPYVEAASQALDAQLLAGRDDWDKVFAYDVIQEAGRWLNHHSHKRPTVTEDFQAELTRLMA
jgi:hypothetical protein